MKKKILIADHDDISGQYYTAVLKKHDLIITQDAHEALNIFLKEKPDLVILNSVLTMGNGFDLAKEIKSIDRNIEIVMITGNMIAKDEALKSGCDKFYLKPVSVKDLMALAN